jgi:hypothetical protein
MDINLLSFSQKPLLHFLSALSPVALFFFHLDFSRNQLSTLPSPVCSLPLKVLIACNNKLVSLPEELGQLLQLTELVSTADTHSFGLIDRGF